MSCNIDIAPIMLEGAGVKPAANDLMSVTRVPTVERSTTGELMRWIDNQKQE
jgi:hypothetical protein